MHALRACAILALLALLATGLAEAQPGFKFSQPDDEDRLANEARQSRIADQLSTPCRASIKDKKIMVVIGEQQSNGYIAAQQQNYGPHFQAINTRLRLTHCAPAIPGASRNYVTIWPTMHCCPISITNS